RRLLVDERLLQRMQRRRLREALLLRVEARQPLERGDGLSGDGGDRRDAGADLDAVGQHRAGAALRQPAAEAWSLEVQLVREHVEQRRVGAGLDRPRLAVDLDIHASPPVSQLQRDLFRSTLTNRLHANKQYCCPVAPGAMVYAGTLEAAHVPTQRLVCGELVRRTE